MSENGKFFGQSARNPEQPALTRRDFLRVAGSAALGGVAAACAKVFSRQPKPEGEPAKTGTPLESFFAKQEELSQALALRETYPEENRLLQTACGVNPEVVLTTSVDEQGLARVFIFGEAEARLPDGQTVAPGPVATGGVVRLEGDRMAEAVIPVNSAIYRQDRTTLEFSLAEPGQIYNSEKYLYALVSVTGRWEEAKEGEIGVAPDLGESRTGMVIPLVLPESQLTVPKEGGEFLYPGGAFVALDTGNLPLSDRMLEYFLSQPVYPSLDQEARNGVEAWLRGLWSATYKNDDSLVEQVNGVLGDPEVRTVSTGELALYRNSTTEGALAEEWILGITDEQVPLEGTFTDGGVVLVYSGIPDSGKSAGKLARPFLQEKVVRLTPAVRDGEFVWWGTLSLSEEIVFRNKEGGGLVVSLAGGQKDVLGDVVELPEVLRFSPTSLTPEVAQKFIAGGEFVKPDQFEGRIFVDGQSGTTMLLSQAARDWLESQSLSVNPLSGPWMETLKPYLDPEGKGVARFGRLTLDKSAFVVLDSSGRAVVFAEKEVLQGYKRYLPIIIYPDGKAEVRVWAPNVGDGTEMHWHDEYGVVADDGYHVRVIYDPEKKKWERVLPHERINGEYELVTDPTERLRSQMNYLRAITGYGGNGVWEKAKDGNGIAYVKVHETSDAASDVVYEVIVDRDGTPQMFTIRKTNNERGIVALNESQAALIRQAWSLLERLDANIYTKFWRVNKVTVVAGLVDDEKKYIYGTNTLKDGKFGMILIRKFSNLVDEAEGIVGEAYELCAAQIGYNEKLFYIGGAPPDTRDSNAMVDAGLRYRDWVNKYGRGYGFEANRWLNYYVPAAGGYHPIEPQIPFEP